MAKATTVRFSDEIFARLDQASSRTGLPVNSIVVAACLEWMDRHTPAPGSMVLPAPSLSVLAPAPRWATLRRAMVEASAGRTPSTKYPFDAFTEAAQQMLTAAQSEATKTGLSYIGTEHLLLAALANPESQAGQALGALGVTKSAVREALANKEIQGTLPAKHVLVPTSRVKSVIEIAFETCAQASEIKVTTGHLLIALAAEGDGIAARILLDAGATPEAIARALPAEPEA